MAYIIMLLCGVMLVLLFAVIGVVSIVISLRSRKKAAASQGWPSAAGQVTHAEVSHSVSTDSEGDTTDTYAPVIRYTYTIGGQAYDGKNITFGFQRSYNQRGQAEAALVRYPLGQAVTVYYNPSNPSEAVLERAAGGSTLGIVIGIIFLLVSLCVGCPVLGYFLLQQFGAV